MQINSDFSSPNYLPRTADIDYIILHYTELSFPEALSRLTDPASEVSCHYLIKEDGQIFRLVNDDMIAWHAGKSFWKNSIKLNQNSIGIELDNLGTGAFADNQMQACIYLCRYLTDKYDLDPSNIIGHSDIAPERKIDPGIFFDWKLLAQNGLGIRGAESDYNHAEAMKILFTFGQEHNEIKFLQKNLQKIGYQIEITAKIDVLTSQVIRAFQAHFAPEIIHNKGLDFYRDLSSRYDWDSFSDRLLKNLNAENL